MWAAIAWIVMSISILTFYVAMANKTPRMKEAVSLARANIILNPWDRFTTPGLYIFIAYATGLDVSWASKNALSKRFDPFTIESLGVELQLQLQQPAVFLKRYYDRFAPVKRQFLRKWNWGRKKKIGKYKEQETEKLFLKKNKFIFLNSRAEMIVHKIKIFETSTSNFFPY